MNLKLTLFGFRYIKIIIFIIQIIQFLILIIILNLYDPSLSESDCNVRSKNLGSDCNTRPKILRCGSGYKAVLWKCDNWIENNLILKNKFKKKLIEKGKTNKKKQSKALFQWIVLCKERYSKILSWDRDNLIKNKQNKPWYLIFNQIDIKR
jgi:hypothetical protein